MILRTFIRIITEVDIDTTLGMCNNHGSCPLDGCEERVE